MNPRFFNRISLLFIAIASSCLAQSPGLRYDKNGVLDAPIHIGAGKSLTIDAGAQLTIDPAATTNLNVIAPADMVIPSTPAPSAMTWNLKAVRSTFHQYGLPIFSTDFKEGIDASTLQIGTSTFTTSSGQLSIVNGSTALSWIGYTAKPPGPSYRVTATIASMPSTGTTPAILVGLMKPGSPVYGLFAQYDNANHKIDIIEMYNGSSYAQRSPSVAYTATFPLTLSLEVNTGFVNVWANCVMVGQQIAYWPSNAGSDWINGRVSTTNAGGGSWPEFDDFNVVAVGTYSSTSVSTPFVVTNLRLDTGGSLAWREPNKVTYLDGSPYIVNDEVFETATDVVSPFDGNLVAMEGGIYARNLYTNAQRLCARTQARMMSVSQQGVRILQWNIGKILYDDVNRNWIMLGSNQSWPGSTNAPNTGNRVMTFARLPSSPLQGVVELLEPQVIPLPYTTRAQYCYDFDVAYINGMFVCVYIESTGLSPDQRITVATSPDIVSGWTLRAQETVRSGEGARIAKIGSTYYALQGSSTGFNAYQLGTSAPYLTYIGAADISALHNGGSPVAHPNIISYLHRDGKTHYQIDSFDGVVWPGGAVQTWQYGRQVILEATETTAAKIFPIRKPASQ